MLKNFDKFPKLFGRVWIAFKLIIGCERKVYMNLGENIFKLRKKLGLSQEELGEKINVTRQTISNWELGETSPNPEQLKQLSKVLNVSIDELLNNDIKEVIFDKVSKTEKKTNIILTILKVMGILFVLGFILIIIYLALFIGIKKARNSGRKIEQNIHCTIFGEEYSYGVTFYESNGQVVEAGGDGFLSNVLKLEQYSDAYQVLDIIKDYAKRNGGSCTVIQNHDLSELVSLSINKKNLTKKNAMVSIKNNSEYYITFGESFLIEKYDNGTNNFEVLNNNTGKSCAFNDIGYVLKPHEVKTLKQDWSCDYNELEKGLYRLVKDMFFDSDLPVDKSDQFIVSVEFEIN